VVSMRIISCQSSPRFEEEFSKEFIQENTFIFQYSTV
jgi:hypothetical protein